MKSLLEEILEKMAAVDLLHCDEVTRFKDVGAGETVLGELSDAMKRLHVVYCTEGASLRAGCEHVQVETDRMFEESPDTMPEEARVLLEEHNAAHSRYDRLHEIFWAFVAADFPQTSEDRYNAGIRKGWQAVIFPRDPQEGLMTLERLFARMGRGNSPSSGREERLSQVLAAIAGANAGPEAEQPANP